MLSLEGTRKLPIVVAAAMTLATASALGVTQAGAVAPIPHFAYQGSAYGTAVAVNSVVTSGRSALVVLGCTTTAGISRSNTTAGINLAPLLKSATIATTAQTLASPVAAQTTANTQQVSLLGGLIHGDAVRAQSKTSYQGGVFTVSPSGTSFTHLVVAGVPITATPGPNTRINLTGYGYLILNEERSRVTATSASLSVNAIHLFINTTNALGIAKGTNVVVSHADSGLGGPVAGTLDGISYGTSVRALGNIANSGPSFPAYMPCLGTNGQLRANTGVGVTLAPALTTGTITDTAQGTVTATSATGEMTSTVQSADVLNSLVKATVIKADAHAHTDGSAFTFSDTGSTFGTLKVTGFPNLGASVAPNTQVTVPNIGTLYLHRVLHTTHSIEIRMIELVLTSATNGLPIGTDIRVSVAEASAH